MWPFKKAAKPGHIEYKPDHRQAKSKWMTTLLTLFFGGLLFLIIMAIWFTLGE